MLDYRIHTFLKVCETLNYTLAAKQLHITQPAYHSIFIIWSKNMKQHSLYIQISSYL